MSNKNKKNNLNTMMEIDIAAMRRIYSRADLDESKALPDPFEMFHLWFNEAVSSKIDEPNAMTLATADADGAPSARIVLLKGVSQGGFVFYTNYGSRKGTEISKNPKAALLFFWKELERQIRITGNLTKVSRDESKEYFNSRPFESKIGALISSQSEIVNSRTELEEKFTATIKMYEGNEVPLPDFWGGYRLYPDSFEFWQGRPSRLHDRISYTKTDSGIWAISRLAP